MLGQRGRDLGLAEEAEDGDDLARLVAGRALDALEQQRVGEALGRSEDLPEPALQGLAAEGRDRAEGRRPVHREAREQLEPPSRLRGHRLRVLQGGRAGAQELAEARARPSVAWRPRPEPLAELGRVVGRRRLSEPPRGRRGPGRAFDAQPARQLGGGLAGPEAHDPRIGGLRVRRLKKNVVPALDLHHLDGVGGAVLVTLVDEAARGGRDHLCDSSNGYLREHTFYSGSGEARQRLPPCPVRAPPCLRLRKGRTYARRAEPRLEERSTN